MLQLLVSHDENAPRRRLVNLTRFDANQSIFHVIDPANAVLSTDLIELLDEFGKRQLLTVKRDWHTFGKRNHNFLGFIRCLLGCDCPLKRTLWRSLPWIFEDATLNRAAP